MSPENPPHPVLTLILLGSEAASVAAGLRMRLAQRPLATEVNYRAHACTLTLGNSRSVQGWQLALQSRTPSDAIASPHAGGTTPLARHTAAATSGQPIQAAPAASLSLRECDVLALCFQRGERETALLGQQLRELGLAHTPLHGELPAQVRQCLLLARHRALQLGWTWPELAELQAPRPRWQGLCEACSDPDCEHRLFSRLTGQGTGD